MSSDRGTSRQPAAAGDQNGGENGEDGAVARRLRVLGSVCAALMVAVLATVAAIGWSVARPGAGDPMESPPAGSFLVAVGAMLLVLLASAAYGRILRQKTLARLRAYSWATGASFGMLAAAAALGAMVASSGKAPFYGLVICIASLFSMVARWPRRSGFELALRPDRPEAVSRAAAWRSLARPVVVTFPAAPGSAGGAGGEDLSPGAASASVAALIAARLRVLRVVCGAMLAGVAVLAAASVIVVQLGVARPVAATGLSLTLTVLAAVLILGGSRLQAAFLARAGRGTGERRAAGGSPAQATGAASPAVPAAAPGMAAAAIPGAAAEVVGAWARATIAGFASFVAVAALGLAVAAVTGVARYALVICGVAALGMLVRWPRRAAVLGLLRRRGLA